jgi:hypothetical protein
MFIAGNCIKSAINESKKQILKNRIPVINYAIESRNNSIDVFNEYKNLSNELDQSFKIALKLTSFDMNLRLINEVIDIFVSKKVKVLIDAESNIFNDDYNKITRSLIYKYNKHNVNIYKTYQMYRKDSLINLNNDIDFCNFNNLHIGTKLVRGAYWNTEKNLGHLFTNKIDTDESYNNGVICLYENSVNSDNIIATHNLESINLGMMLNNKKNIFSFAHLLDMRTKKYNDVVKKGHDVHVYIPYGPYNEMIPYLVRRLYENLDTVKYMF